MQETLEGASLLIFCVSGRQHCFQKRILCPATVVNDLCLIYLGTSARIPLSSSRSYKILFRGWRGNALRKPFCARLLPSFGRPIEPPNHRTSKHWSREDGCPTFYYYINESKDQISAKLWTDIATKNYFLHHMPKWIYSPDWIVLLAFTAEMQTKSSKSQVIGNHIPNWSAWQLNDS